MINEQRILNEFLELVQIDSLSLKEGNVAKVLVKKLEEIGCSVVIDNAGEKANGEPPLSNINAYSESIFP